MDLQQLRRFASGRLQELRKLRGYERTELAERAGVSRDAVRKIENGETSPNLDTIHALCQALRVSLAEFFTTPSGSREDQAIAQLAAYLADKPYERIQLVDQVARVIIEQLKPGHPSA